MAVNYQCSIHICLNLVPADLRKSYVKNLYFYPLLRVSMILGDDDRDKTGFSFKHLIFIVNWYLSKTFGFFACNFTRNVKLVD